MTKTVALTAERLRELLHFDIWGDFLLLKKLTILML